MPGIFVSHAAADRSLVNHFVDDIIRLGCGAKPDEIFYSSGEDTGVPSGYDLMMYLRERVGDASLVVAIISPTFQTRPVCIAELGAAWSRTGNLFPLLVPGMPRTALGGVLPGVLVKYLNDGSALDELHDRIANNIKSMTTTATWGRYREKWLASVDRYAAEIPNARVPTLAELEQAESNLQAARGALRDAQNEIADLQTQLEELAKAKTAEAVRRIRLPKDEVKRFKAVVAQAQAALSELPAVVQKAICFNLSGEGMPWRGGFEDSYAIREARKAVDDGLLLESGADLLVPNTEFGKIMRADTAVREVKDFLDYGSSRRFDEWFRETYDMPPELLNMAVWNAVFGSSS